MMGLRCFERSDFMVLIFLRELRHTEYAYTINWGYFTTPDSNCVDVLIPCVEAGN